MMHELLFVYGTLTEPGIQESVFGRRPDGCPDRLAGFRKLEASVAGRYPEVRPEQGGTLPVGGLCLQLTPEELFRADAYETDLYYRTRVTLESGRVAWVYLAANQDPSP